MAGPAVETLLYLLDQAFAGHEEHALLLNLRGLSADEWLQAPVGGHRRIVDLVLHIGGARLMYANHAFEDGSLTWTDPRVDRPAAWDGLAAQPDLLVDWLRAGHDRLSTHVAALTDAQLLELRRAPWGEQYETRWLLGVMIEHDLYHAGEINHLRALLQGNDRWPWDPA
jgi:uncharacterized damage-inducible protein DinB